MKQLFFLLLFSLLYGKVHIVNKDIHVEHNLTSWIEIKNKNLTRQKEDYSCGSASLATVLKHYYGQDVSEKEILNAVIKMKGMTRKNILQKYKEVNGLSFLDLSVFAKEKGFKVLGLALDMDALKKLQVPVILYVKIRNSEHFTVYKGMDDMYAYLADPSMGNTKVRLTKFKEMFYQREDLEFPGKLLAILPLRKDIIINKDFMIIPKSSKLIYNTIGIKSISN